MSQIELKEAQEHLAELAEQAASGEEVVITKNDRPYVKLIAVRPERQRQFGSAKGLIRMSEDFDEPLEEFREYT